MKINFTSLSKVNKTWVVLGVALAVGLLAAIATRIFLSKKVAEIAERNRYKTIGVVVAKIDLTKNTVLSSKNLAVRNVPVEFAHSGAVSPAEFTRIDGGALAFDVKAGEMIMWSQLAGKRAPTFSARLSQGHRAITVVVDEINSIAGMLEPGDRIDLMFTVDHNAKKVVVPLLQSVQVLATGQRSVDDPKTGTRTQFATVTLDTTPAEATNIIVARDTGKLTALLRNPDDNQSIGNKTYDLASLFGVKLESDFSRKKGIPVLYGGSSAKLPAEVLHLGRAQAGSEPPAPASVPPPEPVVSAVLNPR